MISMETWPSGGDVTGDCRCGVCAIMVNGRPALACRKMAEAEMVIDPDKCEKCADCVTICPVGVCETR